MEKGKLFVGEGTNGATATAVSVAPIWNSCSFGMEMQPIELNDCSEQLLSNCFFNPNWDNPMDQSDPFESGLSSMVSSPAASNANAIPTAGGGVGEAVMIRELIGKLGNINNSSEILPQSYVYNNSTNTSCYSTPLNSPPKLNLPMMDSQIRGNIPILGNSMANHPSIAPFQADPGFAERAARYSCFGAGNLGGLNGQFALNEAEFSHRLVPRVEPGKLSRISSNHSMKAIGSQMNAQEGDKSSPQDRNSNSDKKYSGLSRSTTPEYAEFGDSREESSVSQQIPDGEQSMKSQNEGNTRKRKSIPRGKAKETPSSSPSASEVKVAAENDESSAKRSKSEEANGNQKEATKSKEEKNGNQKQNKDDSKPPEPPKDYIHVRARRGQATDSHSLAERVRREKISERMKFLQDLVPGCNKVTGKAVMLDEIINYVQSLQRQVEFLSMKLATVKNPRMDFNMDALLSKDIFQSHGSMPHTLYPFDSSVSEFPYRYQSQQGLTLHNSIASNAETQLPMNPVNAALRRNPSMQLPSLDGFGDAAHLDSKLWEDELHSVVQMGFGQNQQQSLQGSIPAAHMKIEM